MFSVLLFVLLITKYLFQYKLQKSYPHSRVILQLQNMPSAMSSATLAVQCGYIYTTTLRKKKKTCILLGELA